MPFRQMLHWLGVRIAAKDLCIPLLASLQVHAGYVGKYLFNRHKETTTPFLFSMRNLDPEFVGCGQIRRSGERGSMLTSLRTRSMKKRAWNKNQGPPVLYLERAVTRALL